ncbi:MAG: polysialyltransferase family glycosyltransferase [Undibacterium sp.]|nr:polysialyltransferase family glycosyltransferase [Undibacterium sp.]
MKFISHISTRNKIAALSGYGLQTVSIHPLCSGLSYKNPRTYWLSFLHQLKIDRLFEFKANDILVVTTEYELNNALLARKMKQAGGQVYLFDEGIGFYFNNSAFHDLHIKLIDKLFLKLYDLAFASLGIPAYARKGFEGRMYVCIKEKYIDGIYSRMRLPINRPVKVFGYRNFLASEKAQQAKNETTAIFFANNLSCFGLKEDELLISAAVVREMALKFEVVYLKIHPADWIEKNEIFYFYKKLTGEHANIHLIDNSMTGNEAIESIKPRIVVGTMGATMFDAFFFGCHPIFLFQLLPAVDEFEVCRFTLENMGYKYIKTLEEIEPGYKCGVDASSLLYDEELTWWRQPPDSNSVNSATMPC